MCWLKKIFTKKPVYRGRGEKKTPRLLHPLAKFKEDLDFLKAPFKFKHDKDHYFIRKSVNISQSDIIEWGETQFAGILRDVRHWYDTNYAWPGYYNQEMLETH